jgi:diketogulonate reductase-like aldo/keto reductase
VLIAVLPLDIRRVAHGNNCSAAAVALAWMIPTGKVIAIPESGSVAHLKENAVALSLTFTPEELRMMDAAYPGPAGAN